MGSVLQSVAKAANNVASAEGKIVPAGVFKAKCLQMLDEVAETREPLVITKHGKPVARVVPMPVKRVQLRGALRGSVLWEGDIISPLEDEWEANR